ncbi:type IV secretion system protein VirB3 [Pseudoxanthomonas dokdonensis]|uniref:Type IV secretion system protein VirB3 n=1 Tax=Pseudoxanthomonas dokdonensis TaxID=344882 RepID=A0A0R0D129_9GAMM|nr:VirB3 family type IV secretion system protein [Pseudoxanthomonas dokdonensis]KRG72071.1 hypothetical protein ABB29_01025 [Pseudoxanthomonas dokdonensis]
MHKNALFRGCTRPPMFLGVPYIPFFIAAGSVLLLAMYTNMFFLFLLPVVIFVMRQMARRDEMIFRMLGLHLQTRLRTRNIRDNGGMWVFSQNIYRNKPSRHD